MKNYIKFFEGMRSIAIIAFVTIIGFSMTACSVEEETGSIDNNLVTADG